MLCDLFRAYHYDRQARDSIYTRIDDDVGREADWQRRRVIARRLCAWIFFPQPVYQQMLGDMEPAGVLHWMSRGND